jgi:hypothetical protein
MLKRSGGAHNAGRLAVKGLVHLQHVVCIAQRSTHLGASACKTSYHDAEEVTEPNVSRHLSQDHQKNREIALDRRQPLAH